MSPPPKPRAAVEAMVSYSPPLEGRRQHTRLDFNENTIGFGTVFPEIEPTFLSTYPEYQDGIRELALALGLQADQLLLTNGSDEGLFVACFTFIEPDQGKAVVGQPTFALIPHYLRLCQAQIVEVPVLDDLKPDLEAITDALKGSVKMAVLATPENPTGQVVPIQTLKAWLEEFPRTVFLIDEAYQAYHTESALPLINEFSNLIVSRTFSKAWGLAGLRLGFLAAHPTMIEWMARVRSPYSVNSYAISALRRLLPHQSEVQSQAQRLVERKANAVQEIRNRGYRVTDGRANFFLIWMGPTAPSFVGFCRDRGILLRDRSRLPAMGGSVRVSTGSENEMAAFLELLDEFRIHTALVLDLDDTIVDTSESFDRVVCNLVETKSGQPATSAELHTLRAEGGFNDDWDATVELLRRRGVDANPSDIALEALPIYLKVAREVETPLLPLSVLETLRQRHRLFVVTGRSREEYEPVWHDRLGHLFDEVVCKNDNLGLKPKPAPDQIIDLLNRHGVTEGYYIGNSVDDMRAARGANIIPIGVGTNQSLTTLTEAGAEIVLDHPKDLETLWLIDKPE
jgi:histidinol-phosphate aminotransferase